MDNNYINIELVKDSYETLSTVENLVNYADLAGNFYDMEEYFRQINFEHDNCIDYRESLDDILSNLDYIRKKTNQLVDSLNQVCVNYGDSNNISSNDIKEIKNIYKEINSDNTQLRTDDSAVSVKSFTGAIANSNGADGDTTITRIQSNPSVQSRGTKSTIPIGIGIGVAGVTGAIGTVVVNEKYGPAIASSKIDEYHDDNEDVVSDVVEKEDEEDNISPYHAARMAREADRFYGNELNSSDLDSVRDIYTDE